MANRDDRAQGDDTHSVGATTYQMTVAGLGMSLRAHVIFNTLGATCLLLLGHPAVALTAFGAYCAFDLLHTRLIARWKAQSLEPDVNADAGFRRLGLESLARVGLYMAPVTAVAVNGHPAELFLFGVQGVTLVAAAMSAGVLSRWVFWGMAAPVLAAALGLAIWLLAPLAFAGVTLSLAILFLLLLSMTETTRRVVLAWHSAYLDNVALIPQMAMAREKAEAERAAADEAREEARQAGRAKANFLATMSHEIRTPMNGVLGMAQLLERDETDPKQKERLSVLIDSGEYLLSILNDVLDVSKIDAGRLDIAPAPEDLRLFLDRLVGFWGAQADEKGVSLILDVADSVPNFALIDALRLRQVLFNLVGNALKFTEAGAVTVAARAIPNGEGAVLLHLKVSDTGIGIAPQTLPHLFTRFSQADDSEVRRFGGTGLGLAIAKQLIELMGGRIWADSEVGRGSTFHVKLPLAVALGASPAQAPAPAPTGSPEGLKILAVDDNAVNLLVLDQLLSSMGHKIAKAASGPEALEALCREAYDLVLLDIQMPEMTGVEVLQRLRATESANQHVPVVALTADVTSGGRGRYLGLGFTEHASKPIQIADLLEAIGRAMAADPRASQAA